MLSPWMRKSTWAGVAVGAFVAGVFALRLLPSEPQPPPTASHDIVSLAADSELEISPALAASRNGALAVSWIAETGGHDGGGRYVGVRVSEPGAGALGPLLRVETRGERVSDQSIVALSGGDFLLTWLGGTKVYSARVSRNGVSAPVVVASSASHPRSAATPNGAVLVSFSFDDGARKGAALAISHDGTTFTRRDLTTSGAPEFLGVCGDDHVAIVATVEGQRGVVVYRAPLDSGDATDISTASSIGEHVARQDPTCFVSSAEAFVVYGITEHPEDSAGSQLAESLEFVRSRDDARNFVSRASHRTPTHLLLPTLEHRDGSFILLAIMGAGTGDAHASASVIVLGADGRSQNGLTRTVVAPMSMVPSSDAAGYVGDSLGITEAAGVTWTAVPDNGRGESHIALVHVL